MNGEKKLTNKDVFRWGTDVLLTAAARLTLEVNPQAPADREGFGLRPTFSGAFVTAVNLGDLQAAGEPQSAIHNCLVHIGYSSF